jgi:hypothetical protein
MNNITAGTQLRDIETGTLVTVFAVHEDYVFYNGDKLEGITHIEHVGEFFDEYSE